MALVPKGLDGTQSVWRKVSGRRQVSLLFLPLPGGEEKAAGVKPRTDGNPCTGCAPSKQRHLRFTMLAIHSFILLEERPAEMEGLTLRLQYGAVL